MYHYLREHPDVCMSKPKETWFFCYDHRRGERKESKYAKGIEWYSNTFFEKCGGAKAIGEATPRYMSSSKAPRRIARHIPQAKLIFVLRNPVERLYSQYLQKVSQGHISPQVLFGDVIHDNKGRGRELIERGFYHEHLLRYLKHFDRRQMKIVLYEQFRKNQAKVLREVYEFIGVAPSFEPNTSAQYNVTRQPKNLCLHRLVYAMWEPIEESLSSTVLENIKWLRSAVRDRLFQSGRKQEKPQMKREDREHLQEIYREPNRRLAKHLDRDLSHWT